MSGIDKEEVDQFGRLLRRDNASRSRSRSRERDNLHRPERESDRDLYEMNRNAPPPQARMIHDLPPDDRQRGYRPFERGPLKRSPSPHRDLSPASKRRRYDDW